MIFLYQCKPCVHGMPWVVDKERVLSGALKNLHEKNHEILNLHSVGMKDEQIAKTVGMTVGAVRKTTNSDIGREKLRIMRGASDASVVKVQDRVSEMTEKSLDVLEELLDDEDGKVSDALRQKVAMNVLVDLGGHGAPKKLDIRSQHALVTPEFLEDMKKAGKIAEQESARVSNE